MKRSSMDIGSNTVRLLVARQESTGWVRLAYEAEITRLSGKFDGRLHEDSISRTIKTVTEFVDQAKKLGAPDLRATTTGVTRRASNTQELMDRIEAATGIRPVMISGEQEARLSVTGALAATGLWEEDFIFFDIGGFSTEIALIHAGEIQQLVSLELGAVRLVEDFRLSDIPQPDRLALIDKEIRAKLSPMAQVAANSDIGFSRLVATAGTATSLAAMDRDLPRYESEKVEGWLLSKPALGRHLERCGSVGTEERVRIYPSLEPKRSDLIVPGIQICIAMMDLFKMDEILVTEGSLLEGLLEGDTFPIPQHNRVDENGEGLL